ncbi:MAG: GNAT family N-acetyltransferase [Nocardioides sp.]
MTVTTSPAHASAPALITFRHGRSTDEAAVVRLHDRCSEESRYRRFHAPLPQVPHRLARVTLEPEGGWSVVAELGGDVVGVASAGPLSSADLEVGVLVQDGFQGLGIGTALLLAVADEARSAGYESLLCLTQPDNEAVLGSVARSGLAARATRYDGLMSVVIDLRLGA